MNKDGSGLVWRPVAGTESRYLSYSTVWNGIDADNKPVSSGVYFYKVVTNRATIIKKMLLLN